MRISELVVAVILAATLEAVPHSPGRIYTAVYQNPVYPLANIPAKHRKNVAHSVSANHWTAPFYRQDQVYILEAPQSPSGSSSGSIAPNITQRARFRSNSLENAICRPFSPKKASWACFISKRCSSNDDCSFAQACCDTNSCGMRCSYNYEIQPCASKCGEEGCEEEGCSDYCTGQELTCPADPCAAECGEDGCEDVEGCSDYCAGQELTCPADPCASKCGEDGCEEEGCSDYCTGQELTCPADPCAAECDTPGCEDVEGCSDYCTGQELTCPPDHCAAECDSTDCDEQCSGYCTGRGRTCVKCADICDQPECNEVICANFCGALNQICGICTEETCTIGDNEQCDICGDTVCNFLVGLPCGFAG